MKSPISVLRDAGIETSPNTLVLEREERAVVFLDDERLAYVASCPEGAQRLETERAVLAVVGPSVSFRVPEVLHVGGDGSFDLRTRLPCAHHWDIFHHVVSDDGFAMRLGETVGGMIAELHAIAIDDPVANSLVHPMPWPLPSGQIVEMLPHVVEDSRLRARIRDALARFDDEPIIEQRVFSHGDVGFHNMAFDENHHVLGMFDFDDAGIVDRHWDFSNFALHPHQPEMLEATCRGYEERGQAPLDRARIVLYNAARAFSHLAYRLGHPPDERWCGRTLDEDLAWSHDRLRDLGL